MISLFLCSYRQRIINCICSFAQATILRNNMIERTVKKSAIKYSKNIILPSFYWNKLSIIKFSRQYLRPNSTFRKAWNMNPTMLPNSAYVFIILAFYSLINDCLSSLTCLDIYKWHRHMFNLLVSLI